MTDIEPPPTPQLTKPRLTYSVVDSDQELEHLLNSLSETQVIAIDAERASGFRYGQRAYLIQVAIEGRKIYLIDPTAEFDSRNLTTLKNSLGSKTWVIHAASQDLPCLTEFGLKASNILDTELAGRLLGLPKVSLGAMTEHFLSLALAKEHSAVDWSTRPLPDEWLNYAALDVDVLFELWQAVEEALIDQKKLEIAKAEFSNLLLIEPKQEKVDRWRSVTGIHELKDQRQLTALKSLWLAREDMAKSKDVAPGRLVPDLSLVAVVKSSPKSKSELASLRSFTGRASRTYIDLWWEAYEKGMQEKNLVDLKPKTVGIPSHRNWANKFPDANTRFLWMKKLLRDLSEQQAIPVENLISPEVVRGLCFEPPALQNDSLKLALESRRVRAWQIELVTPLFLEAFSKTEPPTDELKASAPAEV